MTAGCSAMTAGAGGGMAGRWRPLRGSRGGALVLRLSLRMTGGGRFRRTAGFAPRLRRGLFGVTAGFVQENGRLCAERGLLAGAVTL